MKIGMYLYAIIIGVWLICSIVAVPIGTLLVAIGLKLMFSGINDEEYDCLG